jgi:hypothetical protein
MSLDYQFELSTDSTVEKIVNIIQSKFACFECEKKNNSFWLWNSTMSITCRLCDEEDKISRNKLFGFVPTIKILTALFPADQNYLEALSFLGKIIVEMLKVEEGDAIITFNYCDIAVCKRSSGKLFINSKFPRENPLLAEIMSCLDGDLIDIEIPDLDDD